MIKVSEEELYKAVHHVIAETLALAGDVVEGKVNFTNEELAQKSSDLVEQTVDHLKGHS